MLVKQEEVDIKEEQKWETQSLKKINKMKSDFFLICREFFKTEMML